MSGDGPGPRRGQDPVGSLDGGPVPWLRFTIARGDDAAPYLITPKITREDLRKMNGGYLYIVE